MGIEFLTQKELCELTEYRRKAEQRRELLRLGIKFKVSRSGKPLVLKETVVAQFSGRQSPANDFVSPDLDALKKI